MSTSRESGSPMAMVSNTRHPTASANSTGWVPTNRALGSNPIQSADHGDVPPERMASATPVSPAQGASSKAHWMFTGSGISTATTESNWHPSGCIHTSESESNVSSAHHPSAGGISPLTVTVPESGADHWTSAESQGHAAGETVTSNVGMGSTVTPTI